MIGMFIITAFAVAIYNVIIGLNWNDEQNVWGLRCLCML